MASSNPAPTDTIAASSPAGAAETMMPITITHLVMIALAIVATVAMIWWGQRLWRRRRDARDDLEARGDVAEIGDAPITADGSASEPERRTAAIVQPPLEPPVPVEPAAPPPVAPPPPPLADALPSTPVTPDPRAGDLTMLKGLGPKAAALLAERGIDSVAALAALSPEAATALDTELGPFRGRMTRDRWHEQAMLLTRGDRAEYEATFGKLGTN